MWKHGGERAQCKDVKQQWCYPLPRHVLPPWDKAEGRGLRAPQLVCGGSGQELWEGLVSVASQAHGEQQTMMLSLAGNF